MRAIQMPLAGSHERAHPRLMQCVLVLIGCVAGALPFFAHAAQWTRDVEVTTLSGYQHGTTHFVWFSQGIAGCTATPPHFDGNAPGGKSLMVLLTTALVSKRKVDVQTDGCSLVEIYLK